MSSTVIQNQIIAIAPAGEINAANVQSFKNQLISAVESNPAATLVVDMEKVEFLDSAGLMALVTVQRLAQDLNQRLVLCSVIPSIMILFELTQLDKVFEFFVDRDAVHASVRA